MVEVGDTVRARCWTGESVTIRVTKLTESKEHGPGFEGMEIERGHLTRYRALPITHVIRSVTIDKVSRGKWDITFPDGKVERAKSMVAARSIAEERGYTINGGAVE